MPQIKIDKLNVNYIGKKKTDITPVFNDFSCTFESDKINVIIGPSGCGKTTLLKAILGLIKYEGDIYFDDINILGVSLKERNIAYVSQDIVLLPHSSIFQNIAFPLLMSGSNIEEIRKRVNEVANLLGIKDILTRKPKDISIGQAQRVCLAKAIVKRAYLYLLDEPFSNLDQQNRDNFRREVKQIFSSLGATTIFITHSVKEAIAIGDKIFVMNNGTIIDSGTPKQILSSKVQITKDLIKNDEI